MPYGTYVAWISCISFTDDYTRRTTARPHAFAVAPPALPQRTTARPHAFEIAHTDHLSHMSVSLESIDQTDINLYSAGAHNIQIHRDSVVTTAPTNLEVAFSHKVIYYSNCTMLNVTDMSEYITKLLQQRSRILGGNTLRNGVSALNPFFLRPRAPPPFLFVFSCKHSCSPLKIFPQVPLQNKK